MQLAIATAQYHQLLYFFSPQAPLALGAAEADFKVRFHIANVVISIIAQTVDISLLTHRAPRYNIVEVFGAAFFNQLNTYENT